LHSNNLGFWTSEERAGVSFWLRLAVRAASAACLEWPQVRTFRFSLAALTKIDLGRVTWGYRASSTFRSITARTEASSRCDGSETGHAGNADVAVDQSIA
jgi:hypothetical protein